MNTFISKSVDRMTPRVLKLLVYSDMFMCDNVLQQMTSCGPCIELPMSIQAYKDTLLTVTRYFLNLSFT